MINKPLSDFLLHLLFLRLVILLEKDQSGPNEEASVKDLAWSHAGLRLDADAIIFTCVDF